MFLGRYNNCFKCKRHFLGKTRKFKEVNGEEYLRPRVVLITGSGAGEIIDDVSFR